MKYFLPLILAAALLAGCSASSRFSNETETSREIKNEITRSKEIRAALNLNLQKSLSFDFPVNIEVNGKSLITVTPGETIKASNAGGQIEVIAAGKRIVAASIEILAKNIENKIEYNEREYRGYLRIIPYQNNAALLNVADVEDYVRGVMVPEMGVASHPEDAEALKAFAICVRTYAYMKMKARNPYYDVKTDVSDQVYGGYSTEREFTNRAVEETKNTVLLYSGDLAEMFYYSTCGGQTEASGNIFSKDLPYLQSVRDGNPPYCSINPGFSWTESYSGKDIISMLASAGLIGNSSASFTSIEIEDRFPSGRVKTLAVFYNDGSESNHAEINGQKIRSIIRSKATGGILKSLNFEISSTGSGDWAEIKIAGKGNGHGVGLCQWGAIGQSRAGRNFKQILEHYFPGTKLGKVI